MSVRFVALLWLAGALAPAALAVASAPSPTAPAAAPDDGQQELRLVTGQSIQELRSRASRPGVAGTLYDTTWVGHRPGQTGNYWEVGVGPNRPGVSPGGVWTWDTPVKGDSLQGWWPLRMVFNSTGGLNLRDHERPWWAIDIGNNANYVINQSNGRTFGVVGVWHRDNGRASGGGVAWAPLGGSYSAWMGLRRHGDTAFSDPITRNPFNEDVLMLNGIGSIDADGNDKGFPGYGSQMDQMLYRDIDLSGSTGSSLTLSFSYRTNMSTSIGNITTTRTGWFDKDPIAAVGPTNPQLNNFISSSEAGDCCAPRDSFMVYIGAPVVDSACVYSNASTAPVFDPQRRWFAEVLRAHEGLYRELESAAGNVAPVTKTVSLSSAQLAPLLAASGGRLRLVFRVKTNRGFDDEGTFYTSGGAGAAVVDDVTYRIGTGTQVTLGDFEDETEIDNGLATDPLDAWKSTGKPPVTYYHTHPLSDLRYEDFCGPVGDPGRQCNMSGVVISGGDHDRNEAGGGLAGTADRELWDAIISPTICLKTSGPTVPNDWDLTGDMVSGSEFYIACDVYTGSLDLFTKGNFWSFCFQSYPGNAKASSGGYPAWGQVRAYGDFFDPTKECLQFQIGADYGNLIGTSNASGIPDSIRIGLRRKQECLRFGVSMGCSPTDGAYWDNVSLALIKEHEQQIYVDTWQWYNDTFPANETPGFPGIAALFDTCAALIKTGHNIAPTPRTVQRFDVPGDSVAFFSSSETKRMDMVFRILPGPGNYEPVGDGSFTGRMRVLPNNPATITPNDNSFWSVYTRIPGDFASPGAALQLDTASTGWDPNVWVSARCDTLETNLYAFQGRGFLGGPTNSFSWMSTYHESDPRFDLIGPTRFKCFVRCFSCAISDIICDGTVPGYLPAGTSPVTREGNKIIPDGLLTPGAHVEYFFRSQSDVAPGVASDMLPDTNQVTPQSGEQAVDGHRWQEFSVLPDRWKDEAYFHPVYRQFGRGPACMLVIDNNDRRGNERVWVSVADTIGATQPEKWGAHNGWHARGDQDVNDPAARVAVHGGHPGTTWDLYQVKGSEQINKSAGSIGSRLSYRGGEEKVATKSSRQGPTLEMLNAYYSMILFLSGDLNSGILGPYADRSQNDAGILLQWLQAGNPADSAQNRGIWAMGDGFVEDNATYLDGGPQDQLMSIGFRTRLVNRDYRVLSGDGGPVADLRVFPEWQGKFDAAVYGVRSLCLWNNDVIEPSTNLLTTPSSQYERKQGATGGPYTAGVFKEHDASSPWKALVDAWDIEHLTSRNDANTLGRNAYMSKVFLNVWSPICFVVQQPCCVDVPGGEVVPGNFVSLRNNPLMSGEATIDFGLARADRVEARVYDVSGRLVRILANRNFEAGKHILTWDGLDGERRPVARGIYFTRLRYRLSGFADSKKLTLLR